MSKYVKLTSCVQVESTSATSERENWSTCVLIHHCYSIIPSLKLTICVQVETTSAMSERYNKLHWSTKNITVSFHH